MPRGMAGSGGPSSRHFRRPSWTQFSRLAHRWTRTTSWSTLILGPTEEAEERFEAQLWITEANPGGNGLIEQVVEAIATRTDHFYRRIEAALGPSEFEQIDIQLQDYVQRIGGPTPETAWIDATQAVPFGIVDPRGSGKPDVIETVPGGSGPLCLSRLRVSD